MTTETPPSEAVVLARNLWLSAEGPESAEEIERLYRAALTSSRQSQPQPSTDGHDRPTKKAKKDDEGDSESLSDEEYFQAGERLALLLCQSGRCRKAKRGLASLGFTCRLAEVVLDYPMPRSSSETNGPNLEEQDESVPCQIVDDFLPEPWLKRLGRVFVDPKANYWTCHNYTIEPPSPYFSYIIPLGDGMKSFGFLGQVIERIVGCPLIAKKFPKIRNATAAEMWAHNRPHGSGHQRACRRFACLSCTLL